MNTHPQRPDDLAARMVVARERNRQRILIRDLAAAGVSIEAGVVQFVSDAEMEAIRTRARESGLQHGEWLRRSSWVEIVSELSDWLHGQSRVVSALNRVTADCSWFAEHLEQLGRLWRDLYLYSPDGMSGYLVNLDPERGLETLSW